jgi:D-alanyl-D-alanine carboxypeptidase
MKYTLTLLLLIYAFTCKSQVAPQYIQDGLQAILDNSLPSDPNPGAVLTVYVPGQWTWSGASGYAISGETVGTSATLAQPSDYFRVGSISKTFASVCILQLEEAGLLDIDDTIGLYLRPTLVNDTIQSSTPVSIRQLLTHTSGIANSADNVTCQQDALSDLTRFFSIEENIECGASQGEMFNPGSSWYYSNTNYAILAMIIQNVTGQDYWDYVSDSIITPTGLSNTLIPTTDEIQGSYMGCYWDLGGATIDMSIVDPSLYKGWAEMVSTTSDLTLYFEALNNGELIHDTTFAKMLTINAPATYYSLGLEQYHTALLDSWGHSGSVGNTSGMFFVDISTTDFPDGYYIAYNHTYEGVDIYNQMDVPVLNFMYNYAVDVNKEQKDKFQIYPNPSNGFFTVSTDQEIYAIDFFNLTGEVIANYTNIQKQHSFNLTEFPNGIYLYRISAGDFTSQGKIIIR